jgi:hypothetical protein
MRKKSSRSRKSSFRPVKRPGALTRKAKRAGESVREFAREHYHDSGKTGEQARFAVIARKWKHRGSKKRTTKSRAGGRR